MSGKIVIFGGTFDPVHTGHLIMTEQAYSTFNLDRVVFMPAGDPPHKDSKQVTDSSRRLEMLKLAISDNSHFKISEKEINQTGESFTVDTLKFYEKKFSECEIYFLIGADSLLDICNWKEPDYILENANLIVVGRSGFSLENIFRDDRYRPYRNRIKIIDNFLIDISSSQIRKLCRKGGSIRYLVPENVERYIKVHNLYRSD